MTQDRHGNLELYVFADFARYCPIHLLADRAQKRFTPEPDVLCPTEDQGSIAFELVTVNDSDSQRAVKESSNLIPLLESAFDDAAASDAISCPDNFIGLSIGVGFDDDASPKVRKSKAIPRAMELLEEIGPHPGRYSITGTDRQLINTIIIRENSCPWLGKPMFHLLNAVYVGLPHVDRIASKIERPNPYLTDHPLHLLAWGDYDLAPEIWRPKVERYLWDNLATSQFERVWIYERAAGILFDSKEIGA
jgi:hypothetical protein